MTARLTAVWLLATAGVLTAPSAALSQDQTRSGVVVSAGAPRETQASDFAFSPGMSERFRVGLASDPALDTDGSRAGRTTWGENRFRFSPSLRWGTLEAGVQFDAGAGQVFGTRPDLGAQWATRGFFEDDHGGYGFDPRQAWLKWTTPVGQLQVGQMASHWGLGLLANDGQHDSDDLFSDPRNGDLVDRVLFATTPAAAFTSAEWARHLYLGLGGDVVFRDENADLTAGDLAFQGVGSLFWKDRSLFAGFYCAYRHQEDDSGAYLRATALDLYASWTPAVEAWPFVPGLALEAVYLMGRTDRAYSEWTQGDLDVRAFALVGRLQADFPDLGLLPRLEVGLATGDRNVADGTSRGFTLDPDHHVGMILFEEVLAWTSAAGADRAADPARLNVPPRGLSELPTEGSVRNAFYLFPTLRYRPSFGLDAALGALAAWAPAGLADPVESARHGAYPTNAFGAGADAWSFLGTEVDARLGWRHHLKAARLRLGGGVQGGVFLPGNAFNAADGVTSLGTVTKARVYLDVSWE